MIFHKERNHWGCDGYRCVEYSLLSMDVAWHVLQESLCFIRYSCQAEKLGSNFFPVDQLKKSGHRNISQCLIKYREVVNCNECRFAFDEDTSWYSQYRIPKTYEDTFAERRNPVLHTDYVQAV